MSSPRKGGGIKRCFCLTSVAYTGNNSSTERPSKIKIGREVAHDTRDSDTTFKVKRSKVKVARPVYSPTFQHAKYLALAIAKRSTVPENPAQQANSESPIGLPEKNR